MADFTSFNSYQMNYFSTPAVSKTIRVLISNCLQLFHLKRCRHLRFTYVWQQEIIFFARSVFRDSRVTGVYDTTQLFLHDVAGVKWQIHSSELIQFARLISRYLHFTCTFLLPSRICSASMVCEFCVEEVFCEHHYYQYHFLVRVTEYSHVEQRTLRLECDLQFLRGSLLDWHDVSQLF